MDYEYRQFIAGSPFIEEGVASRLKSNAASAIAMGESTMLESPLQAKIKSLWEGVLSSLEKLLADATRRAIPAIRQSQARKVNPRSGRTYSPITPQQEKLMSAIDDLYKTIRPPLASLQAPRAYGDPTISTGPINYGINYDRPRSTQSTKLTELMKEASGVDIAFKSGDANKILNAYKKAISDILKEFKNSVMKLGVQGNMVSIETKKIHPPYKYKNVLDRAEKIVTMPDLGIPSASGAATQEPMQQPPQQVPQPQAAAAADPNVPQPPPPQPTPPTAHSATPAPPQQSGNTGSSSTDPQFEQSESDKLNVSDEDYARIVDKVIQIIISTIRSDDRSKPFFELDWNTLSRRNLDPNTEWKRQRKEDNAAKQGSVTEADAAQPAKDPAYVEKPQVSVKKTHQTKEEIPHQFLYNVGSKKTKYANWSLEVVPPNPSVSALTLSNGTQVDVKVIWSNRGGLTDLIAKVQFPGGKTEKQTVLRYYGDQANPKVETGKKFSVDTLLRQADPTGLQKINSARQKSSQAVTSIYNSASGNNLLLRSLFAVVYRKAMEHKGIEEETPLTVKDDGSVEDENGEKITKSQIAAIIWGNDKNKAKELITRLTDAGYFEAFPKMKSTDSFPAAKDAFLALRALGHTVPDATYFSKIAFINLMNSVEDPDSITTEQVVQTALEYINQTPPSGKSAESGKPPASSKEEPGKFKNLKMSPSTKDLAYEMDGKFKLIMADDVVKALMKYPYGELAQQLKQLNLLDQYKELIDKAKEQEKNPSEKKVDELINPFQMANFI
jgi:hypothetical protein